ncbi:MAG TPA: hypothetical protein PK926_04860 [Spirochaetota bacterium]|nr:hypothetical protein [Spirochaetota bacterium]HPI90502.1 hypothetical protein [Spirochaetota bacterium]HPR46960.1 hypothetical protein [Spirochaetota bacterium]
MKYRKHLSEIIAGIFVVLLATTAVYAEDAVKAAEPEKEDASIGLSIGLTYYSNYLWRGTYFYGGEGAFCPSVSWDIFSTGLVVSAAGEFAADYFFEGDGRDAAGFDFHSVDFGLDYSHTFADLVTIGAGIWYWYYFNSEDALGSDASFLTAKVSLGFDVLLSPFVSFTYDYYVDEDFCTDGENKKDFYIQAGIGHEFEVTPEVAVGLGLAAGYYHAKSIEAFGISDIDASVGLTYTKGIVSVSSSFHYVAVPMKDFYTVGSPNDIHRWYATFGASVSL